MIDRYFRAIKITLTSWERCRWTGIGDADQMEKYNYYDYRAATHGETQHSPVSSE